MSGEEATRAAPTRVRARALFWPVLFLALGACGPVLSWRPLGSAPPGYKVVVVRPGENLYEIAWRYGLDDRTLARWNGISPPYTIYPGERIRLYPSAARRPARRAVVSALATHRYPGPWVWPARGRIFTPFTGSGLNGSGIDILGRRVGERVRAAHAGRVLYAGHGIPAYGRLIIIRDDLRTLTAYAFNRRILVRTGEVVHAGETIATMGRHDGRPLLHFEIRHDGRPVDPLRYVSPP
jgi:lipoprotein NlpD